MMLHPLVMAIAVAGLAGAALAAMAGGPSRPLAFGAAAMLMGLALERLAAGVRATRRFRDPTPLVFPLLHLGRDLAWVAAIAMWSARRLGRRPMKPSHSMRPRTHVIAGSERLRPAQSPPRFGDDPGDGTFPRVRPARPTRVLGLIPAYNEAATLQAVVAELRSCRPDLDVLVVDDGSTDATASLLDRLDVRWLRLPERMGVGSAMRAGLRYAARLGYDVVVRMDGDGQHRPEDIDRLLAPIRDGRADVVLGSRYAGPGTDPEGVTRLAQRLLAACLSALTGRRVTDPTSGFYGLGPRAVRVLAEHHPTGYPEPELRLFLSRNALKAIEVPVRGRPRPCGRTSLTAGRVTAAGARVMLAMIIVPLRCRVPARGESPAWH
jgi:hypothetical protein